MCKQTLPFLKKEIIFPWKEFYIQTVPSSTYCMAEWDRTHYFSVSSECSSLALSDLSKKLRFGYDMGFFTMEGLAQSVEHLTAERKVVGLIPGAGP